MHPWLGPHEGRIHPSDELPSAWVCRGRRTRYSYYTSRCCLALGLLCELEGHTRNYPNSPDHVHRALQVQLGKGHHAFQVWGAGFQRGIPRRDVACACSSASRRPSGPLISPEGAMKVPVGTFNWWCSVARWIRVIAGMLFKSAEQVWSPGKHRGVLLAPTSAVMGSPSPTNAQQDQLG